MRVSMSAIDWRSLPQIESIGPIPAMGDTFYDGIIEAHNNDYYILTITEIPEDRLHHNDPYEIVYAVYKMDAVLRYLLDPQGVPVHIKWDLIMCARDYVERKKAPYGVILESNLQRM